MLCDQNLAVSEDVLISGLTAVLNLKYYGQLRKMCDELKAFLGENNKGNLKDLLHRKWELRLFVDSD